MSFLEMMDQLNEKLTDDNEEPVAFDHDCREGVCGMCSMVINGEAHGPKAETTTCQLYMRHFDDGAEIFVERISVTTRGPNQNRTRFRSSRVLPKPPWTLPVASAAVLA